MMLKPNKLEWVAIGLSSLFCYSHCAASHFPGSLAALLGAQQLWGPLEWPQQQEPLQGACGTQSAMLPRAARSPLAYARLGHGDSAN